MIKKFWNWAPNLLKIPIMILVIFVIVSLFISCATPLATYILPLKTTQSNGGESIVATILLISVTIFGAYNVYSAYQLAKKRDTQYQIIEAWNTVTKKFSGGGKLRALEFLAKEGESLDGIDLSYKTMEGIVYLAGIDLSEKTLGRKVSLNDANLVGVNLARANLDGAQLKNAQLNGANLNNAKLNHTILTEANLMRANLVDAELNHAKLTNAMLNDANLTNAKLNHAILTNAVFSGDINQESMVKEFKESNKSKQILGGAILNDAELNDADLTKADLRGCKLNNAKLNDAILIDAVFDQVNIILPHESNHIEITYISTDLTNAELNDADLTNANLSCANFSGAKLNNTILNKANLTRTRFDDAILNHAKLIEAFVGSQPNYPKKHLNRRLLTAYGNASFINAKLNHADLTEAKLNHVTLTKVELNDAILNKTTFICSSLTDAEFINATFTNTKLIDAHLTNANFQEAKFTDVDLTFAEIDCAKNLTQKQLDNAHYSEKFGVSDISSHIYLFDWRFHSKINDSAHRPFLPKGLTIKSKEKRGENKS